MRVIASDSSRHHRLVALLVAIVVVAAMVVATPASALLHGGGGVNPGNSGPAGNGHNGPDPGPVLRAPTDDPADNDRATGPPGIGAPPDKPADQPAPCAGVPSRQS